MHDKDILLVQYLLFEVACFVGLVKGTLLGALFALGFLVDRQRA